MDDSKDKTKSHLIGVWVGDGIKPDKPTRQQMRYIQRVFDKNYIKTRRL